MGQKLGAFACALISASALSMNSIAEEPAAENPFGTGGPLPAAGRGTPPEQTAAAGAELVREHRWSMATGDAEEMEANARIESVLHGLLKSSLDFSDAPLNAITVQIEQEYDIPIVFDTTALDAIAASPETEVSIRIDNVTLATALDLMLRHVEDLAYVVDNEVLLITTTDEAQKRLETRVYRVDDLVVDSSAGRTEEDYDRLIDVIISQVERDSWQENGTGEGDVMAFPPGVLVVSQTFRVHQRVESLLATLREMRKQIAANPTPGAVVAVQPITRGFAISEEISNSNEACKLLREAIQASVDWQARGELEAHEVFIHILPERLLVRHLPRVVGQVDDVLEDALASSRVRQSRGTAGGSTDRPVRGGGRGGGSAAPGRGPGPGRGGF